MSHLNGISFVGLWLLLLTLVHAATGASGSLYTLSEDGELHRGLIDASSVN